MNKSDFYSTNYYNLIRINQEESFIELLNNSNLDELILPSLKKLIDLLFLKITENTSPADLKSLIINETEIEENLSAILSKNKLYISISDATIAKNLFSNSFLRFCKKIFIKNGINDEKYILESYVQYWLENNLAKKIAKDARFSSYEIVRKLLGQLELLHQFYKIFKVEIPVSWIKNESAFWISTAQNPENAIEGARTFDKDYFKGYAEQLNNYKSYTTWKYVFEATRFSDHALLNEENSFKSTTLLEKNIPLWIKFWDNLRWPLLQDLPFHYINTLQDILSISNELVNQKETIISNPKHLAFILLKNFFETSLRVQENLSFYNDENRIKYLSKFDKDDEILLTGKEYYESWKNEKEDFYKKIISSLLEIINNEEIEEWIFSFKPKELLKGNHQVIYNDEIGVLIKSYSFYISSQSLENQIKNIKDFNLQKFNFLVYKVDSTLDKKYIAELMDKLIAYIQLDQFYWDRTFSPAYWPTLKGIGLLLSLYEKPLPKAIEIVKKFKASFEGWNISPNDYKLTQKEVFIYCGVILMFEHDNAFKVDEERIDFFNTLETICISQMRFSPFDKDNDYKLPLYLLYLIANQIYSDLKKSFEIELIKHLDNIKTVIEILSSHDYPLTADAKSLMKSRIDTEFIYEKRILIERGQKENLELLEKSIEKLNLD